MNEPGGTRTLLADESQTPISGSRGAECGALSSTSVLSSHSEPLDPCFEMLLQSWKSLPSHIKESIHILVSSTIKGGHS